LATGGVDDDDVMSQKHREQEAPPTSALKNWTPLQFGHRAK